jgi:hypothetical protein
MALSQTLSYPHHSAYYHVALEACLLSPWWYMIGSTSSLYDDALWPPRLEVIISETRNLQKAFSRPYPLYGEFFSLFIFVSLLCARVFCSGRWVYRFCDHLDMVQEAETVAQGVQKRRAAIDFRYWSSWERTSNHFLYITIWGTL